MCCAVIGAAHQGVLKCHAAPRGLEVVPTVTHQCLQEPHRAGLAVQDTHEQHISTPPRLWCGACFCQDFKAGAGKEGSSFIPLLC